MALGKHGVFMQNPNACEHNYIDFCPYGCFQERDSEMVELIATVLQKYPTDIENIAHRLHYKQAEARQLTEELSYVLQEIAQLEEQLAEARQVARSQTDI